MQALLNVAHRTHREEYGKGRIGTEKIFKNRTEYVYNRIGCQKIPEKILLGKFMTIGNYFPVFEKIEDRCGTGGQQKKVEFLIILNGFFQLIIHILKSDIRIRMCKPGMMIPALVEALVVKNIFSGVRLS
jgi:hypothetical protein